VSIRKSDLIHRIVLFLAMLMSGGSLLAPRLPILIIIVLVCLAARDWTIDLRREMLPIVTLLAVIFLVTLVRVEGAGAESTAIRFANFIAALPLLDVYLRAGSGALQRDLYAILKLMVWQALLTVVLGEALGFLFIEVDVQDTVYHTLLGLFTYHVTLEESTALIRPDGFFYEPGVFQIYLNILLYLALFVFRNAFWSILAVAAVFSTQSTTGILICLILVGTFVTTRYITRGSLPARIAKVIAAIVLVVPLVYVASGNIRDKITGESQGSFLARQYDLLTGINVVTANPLLGIGFDYDQYHHAAGRLGYADTPLPGRMTEERTNSNGVVFLLYSVGIPLSIPFLVGMFRQRFFPHRVLMGIVLFLALMGESIIFTPFFLMIIYSGLLLRGHGARTAPAANAL
jgi:O-Antigen ligase